METSALPPAGARYDRSGFASLDDVECPAWRHLFEACERAQAEFLAHEDRIFDASYPWPHRPLATWSRVVEYPWVLHHLDAWRRERPAPAPARLLDFGSGATFFPFLVASRGVEVTAADPDPAVERCVGRAVDAVPHERGRVGFARVVGGRVPRDDGAFGAACCVSVLEHVDDLEGVVAELARLLEPGGRLVLTADVALAPGAELSPAAFARLLRVLEEAFAWVHPPLLDHPLRLFTWGTSPQSPARRTGRLRTFIEALKKDVKRLLGIPFPPDHDAALFLGVLRRRP